MIVIVAISLKYCSKYDLSLSFLLLQLRILELEDLKIEYE